MLVDRDVPSIFIGRTGLEMYSLILVFFFFFLTNDIRWYLSDPNVLMKFVLDLMTVGH